MDNREKQQTSREEKRDKATALVPIGEKGIILRTFEELRKFAELAVDAGAAPKGMSPGAAALAIQAGLERGLGPLAGLRLCVVINGNLAWNAQGASALIRRSSFCKQGTLNFWVEGEGMDRRGIAVAHRVGYKEPSRREFTWAEAVKAKLTSKDNWIKYPDRHLQARALGFLARDIFPDVLIGFPLEDEAIDFDERPPVQAEVKVAGPPPPPPAGPDPVLEALEKAPDVIDVEPVDLDRRVERAGPSSEVEKTEGASLRSKLGIEDPSPPASGPPPPPPLPSPNFAPGWDGGMRRMPAEVLQKARSRPESQYQGSHTAEELEKDLTPPRGIRVVSPPPGESGELPLEQPEEKENRAADHLAVDAELAAEERDRK